MCPYVLGFLSFHNQRRMAVRCVFEAERGYSASVCRHADGWTIAAFRDAPARASLTLLRREMIFFSSIVSSPSSPISSVPCWRAWSITLTTSTNSTSRKLLGVRALSAGLLLYHSSVEAMTLKVGMHLSAPESPTFGEEWCQEELFRLHTCKRLCCSNLTLPDTDWRLSSGDRAFFSRATRVGGDASSPVESVKRAHAALLADV